MLPGTFSLIFIFKAEKVKPFQQTQCTQTQCTAQLYFGKKGYLLQSSVIFLMLCSTQNLC